MVDRNKMSGGLLGVAVGDALGLPVEFESRARRKADPVTEMTGYGTHGQPKGSWSDDSSLTFCLAESLCKGFDLHDMARRFVRWLDEGYWTPYGEAFDIGGTTLQSVGRLKSGVEPTEAGGRGEYDNGNGSLMRILPVALYFADSSIEDLLRATHQVSSLTHAHPRSQMACGFYNLMVVELLKSSNPLQAYHRAIEQALEAYNSSPFSEELSHFERLLGGRIHEEPEEAIRSSGYVVHTLEASIWAFLRTASFSEAVLAAVNLGEDTDTTGAVTGGLAGTCYGLEAIPRDWIATLARLPDIMDLAERLYQKITERRSINR